MPQISLTLSSNIDSARINFINIFQAIHKELGNINNLDIHTCHSGVIQESFSYIGLGDSKATKVYLEILWLEDEQRSRLKQELGKKVMQILKQMIVPQVEQQGLNCIPRVRINHLGDLNQDYHICALTSPVTVY